MLMVLPSAEGIGALKIGVPRQWPCSLPCTWPGGTQPGMRSNREERCHPLAADFPWHSSYTERWWMRLSAGPRWLGGVWGMAKDSRPSLWLHPWED